MQASRLKIWITASRPKTLWAAFSPVIIGTAMAYGEGKVHWLSAFLAAVGAILIQIGTNFSNDYYDYFRGVDKKERLGPLRVTQAGLVKPETMKRATILIFSLAFISGLYLIYRGGWPVLIIGLLSILFGILYTAGPYPLGYNGLGDIFVLIFFGLVAVGGTYYVQALEINKLVLLAGLSPGLFSTAILTVNNLRDIYIGLKQRLLKYNPNIILIFIRNGNFVQKDQNPGPDLKLVNDSLVIEYNYKCTKQYKLRKKFQILRDYSIGNRNKTTGS